MNQKSKKVIEAESWVDKYIETTRGVKPTYQELSDGLGISKSSAWNRCAKFRDKMVSRSEPNQEKFTKVKLEYLVPNSQFVKFSSLLTQINQLFKP